MDHYKGNQDLRDQLAVAERLLRRQDRILTDVDRWIQQIETTYHRRRKKTHNP